MKCKHLMTYLGRGSLEYRIRAGISCLGFKLRPVEVHASTVSFASNIINAGANLYCKNSSLVNRAPLLDENNMVMACRHTPEALETRLVSEALPMLFLHHLADKEKNYRNMRMWKYHAKACVKSWKANSTYTTR